MYVPWYNYYAYLQEDLDRKMSSGVSLPSSLTDQIIQQHYNQMNYLNEQLQQRRKRQEKTILEKLRVKKEKMEELVSKLS